MRPLIVGLLLACALPAVAQEDPFGPPVVLPITIVRNPPWATQANVWAAMPITVGGETHTMGEWWLMRTAQPHPEGIAWADMSGPFRGPANPLAQGVLGGVATVLTNATTALGPGSELDPGINEHQQEWKNRAAGRRYSSVEAAKAVCSKGGGTPVVNKAGVTCIPAPLPPPPQGHPCPYGESTAGICRLQPVEEVIVGDDKGRHNDNGQDSPFPGDSDCWTEDGIHWHCI
jgi:hypothetical protein